MLDYTRQFDRRDLRSFDELVVSGADIRRATEGIDASVRTALERAGERIGVFHQRQVQSSGSSRTRVATDSASTLLPWTGLASMAPGGKAAYPRRS